MELELVKNENKYFEFIRLLRNHKDNISGFLDQGEITPEQQLNYMKKNEDCYYVCIDKNKEPVGWIGAVENDIRVCVHMDNKNKGVGKFMIIEFSKLYPLANAKVLLDNQFSNKLFQSCDFEIYKVDNYFNYYKKN